MKSEHRHELKSNELADWLSNLPQWLNENIGTIIITLVVICIFAGFFVWRFYSRNVQSGEHEEFTNMLDNMLSIKADIVSQQMGQQSSDTSYFLLTQANEMSKFADRTENNNIAAFGLVAVADAYRSELHYRPEMVNKNDLTENINKAKTNYSQAIAKSPSNKTVRAIAKFGLGLCAEEIGDFNEAREIYSNIIKEPDFAGTIVVNKAKLRLETMDDYKQQIVFKPKPIPPAPIIEPNDIFQPAIEMLPKESNQPGESNILWDINTPAGISTGSEESDANLPFDINVQE